MKPMRIDVWSDVACPWCYVGKRRLEAALMQFPHRQAVSVVWRAFELDTSAPRELDSSKSYAERIGSKYGVPTSEAQGMIDRMVSVAAADGLEFRFDKIRPGNTFDAHRVIHFAYESGKQDEMKERLLRAYMTEGESIGDREVLIRLATEVGLDGSAVRALLASEAHQDAVRSDEEEARKLDIRGVPFFVIDAKYAVSGAQSADVLLGALERAWQAREPKLVVTVAEGATCGPNGCD
jgi:predicted DsbA family dithiol-disulfide isomerase